MRLFAILVLVSVVSVMFFTGCQNKPPAVQTPPPVVQTPPPTGEELGSTTPPGTGEHVITTPPVDSGPGPGPVDASGARTYTVKAHEGLMAIAKAELGDKHRWKEILALNPEIQPPDYKLKVGQVIKLPASSKVPSK